VAAGEIDGRARDRAIETQIEGGCNNTRALEISRGVVRAHYIRFFFRRLLVRETTSSFESVNGALTTPCQCFTLEPLLGLEQFKCRAASTGI